jgi:hypothetical protein
MPCPGLAECRMSSLLPGCRLQTVLHKLVLQANATMPLQMPFIAE